MEEALAQGQLVSWQGEFGVVQTADGGQRATIRFDSGSEQTFALGSDVLERVELPVGERVRLLADGEVGVIINALEAKGLNAYGVQLGGGVKKTVLESGLRPAIITDPLELLRMGRLDSARSCNLRLTGTRLAFAHQYDELSSLSNSRVEIKPHQVAVLDRVISTYPHRFLLADEVGLGKTIEAGLIIKELKARGLANRVLILAPSGLVSQWQEEMRRKFNEVFARYTRESITHLRNTKPGENVWGLEGNVLVSSSFATYDDERPTEIAAAGWDLVVIDEAHHARRTWRGENKSESTRLYRLAEMLADPEVGGATSFLMLTATPMQLHRFELYSLIELLDPALFPSFDEFDNHCDLVGGLNSAAEAISNWEALSDAEKAAALQAAADWTSDTPAAVKAAVADPGQRIQLRDRLYDQHRLSEVLIRNRKSVVGGFQPRAAAVWEVELTPDEREAYDGITDYALHGYARARATKNNALGFLMATFQKLATSSSRALARSLSRRIEKLETQELAAAADEIPEDAQIEEGRVVDALDDLLGVSATELVARECRDLETILDALDGIERDSKCQVLLDRLAELAKAEPSVKIIIFTQFRETQEYLREQIREPWTTHLFHGSLKMAEKDDAVDSFRQSEGPQVLISTEAGGEGRNFQFCHIVVNYDLPWNPMKVEQRIGRLDRIGQRHPVKIFNFSTRGTIEARVVEVLTNRIGLFEATVGGLDPILGDVESDLSKVFALADQEAARALDAYERQLEVRVEEARDVERRLADLIMDTRSFRQDEVHRLLERKGTLDNEDLQRFVLGALSELGCRIEPDGRRVGVFQLVLRGGFTDLYPQLVKEGAQRHVTFDPAVALEHENVEFLAFGHEIVEVLVARVRERGYKAKACYRRIFTDEVLPREGWLFNYALELSGVVGTKQVLPIFIGLDGEPDEELASWLLGRSNLVKREEFDHQKLPTRDDLFEQAATKAEAHAAFRQQELLDELSEKNRQRVEQERDKLERFYSYKRSAAAEKLARETHTFERISASDDSEVRRILPALAQRVENARRLTDQLEAERERRLADLMGRAQVAPAQELLTAAFVEILPALEEVGLRSDELRSWRWLAGRASPEELAEYRPKVEKRTQDLKTLATKHPFDLETAMECAEKVRVLLRDPGRLTTHERAMVRGATEYFLLLQDAEPDVKHPEGFADDLRLISAVEAAIAG